MMDFRLCALLSLLRATVSSSSRLAGQKLAKRMTLEPSPEEFHWIQARRIRRQECHLDVAAGGILVLPDKSAAMRLQPVPDDQQALLEVRAQRLEELHVLLFLDAAFVQPEHALGARESGDDRDVRPVEVELDDGRLALWRPGSHACWPLAQAGFVDVDTLNDASSIRLHLEVVVRVRFEMVLQVLLDHLFRHLPHRRAKP